MGLTLRLLHSRQPQLKDQAQQALVSPSQLQEEAECLTVPKYKRDLVQKLKILRQELSQHQPQAGHCRIEVSREEIFEVGKNEKIFSWCTFGMKWGLHNFSFQIFYLWKHTILIFLCFIIFHMLKFSQLICLMYWYCRNHTDRWWKWDLRTCGKG